MTWEWVVAITVLAIAGCMVALAFLANWKEVQIARVKAEAQMAWEDAHDHKTLELRPHE